MGALSHSVQLVLTHLNNRIYGAQNESVAIGDHISGSIVTVPTSEIEITFDSAVGNARDLYLHNQDADNFIDVGWATGDYKMQVRPGQRGSVPVQPTASSIFVRADTAAALLEWMLTEESS